jgi:hypothetical protein
VHLTNPEELSSMHSSALLVRFGRSVVLPAAALGTLVLSACAGGAAASNSAAQPTPAAAAPAPAHR